MTSKIFRSTVFTAVIVLLCSLGVVLGVLYTHFSGVQVGQLKDELSLAATGTQLYGSDFLENIGSQRFRVTWVDADGTVLYDTQVDAAGMENHKDREEIREALETGFGTSSRYSDTLTEKTLYEAMRLEDGTVLRISASQASAAALVLDMIPAVLLIAAAAAFLSALLARRVAGNIVEPINKLDLEHPLQNDAYDEISPLLRRINQQHLQISAQLEELRRKANEFEQITGNMKEGLVLLNSDGVVLNMNPTAQMLFAADSSCIGKNFLQIDRSREMRSALNAALDKGHGSARAQRNGREYHFDLSRIESDGMTVGAVVLAFDVTETMNAERKRREFSANVSHELKTPLQSIIGSAELLENGMVKQEDLPHFVGMIRKEAVNLLNMIGDIIRLSQLDEGVAIPMEEVDLLHLSQEVSQELHVAAQEKGITLTVEGEACSVSGVRRLLYEIIYNLCDNAIKYNVPGGSVQVSVRNQCLTVADTGVGILPEDKERIFERFYRADKSHSKQSGGSGLGLSIVKHAVQYHNATLTLDSTPGQGTTISIQF